MLKDPSGHHWYFLWADDLGQNVWEGMKARKDAMYSEPSLYTVGNWLTMGAFDMAKGAVNPDKPLSLEHWVDSAGIV